MAGKYDHKKVEKKWQEKWEKEGAFAAEENSTKEELYILDMFPYPSGSGLHVGHVEGYTATDIYSRFKRMLGYNVLHPMGWDAFGLPAENYAIKTGIPPAKTTNDAITTFRKQIKNLGLSYDWSREVGAHTPEYYKWTQWFFLFLYKNGLAYKKKAFVNWDPVDQTVLANEQVLPDGTAERSGAKVEQKELEQWFLRITDYADALVDDLDKVDWPESTKINQRNWIGRSEGAEISFDLVFKKYPEQNSWRDPDGKPAHIKVFTTRPDTLFGATYMVLAPEHPWVRAIWDTPHDDAAENKEEIYAYVENARKKTELERRENREKTGVEIKGIRAINPATKEEIPIFVADYVLMGYGTGAIMAVPAHDERDYAFAKKFNIPIKYVVHPNHFVVSRINSPATKGIYTSPSEALEEIIANGTEPLTTEDGTLINSEKFNGFSVSDAKKQITEAVGGKHVKTYRLRDWLISRQRYWGAPIPVVYDPEGSPHPIPEEHLPWLLPTDVEFKPTGTSPLGQSKELLERTERIFGKGWRPEVDTMDTFVCSSWYYYRFSDPKNDKEFASKEQIKKWLPVDLYMGGAEHTVLHLMYARFFTKVLQTHGFIGFGEPFLKLRHQGTILAEDGSKMSKSKGNVINPDEVVERFGADTLRLYEMFMGPLEAPKPWNTSNILGVRRFLERVWKLEPNENAKDDPVLLHGTIKKVGEDIEGLKMNTAVSALMILLNALEEKGASKKAYEVFIRLLAPLAPHISSELAERHSIDLSLWPSYDEKALARSTVKLAVQINGKVRGTIEVASEALEEEVLAAARSDERVRKWLALGKEIKAVYVPGKIVSFVVG